MRLSDLRPDAAALIGSGEVEISGLATDSRVVRPGDLFAALAGSRADGRQFVGEALARGAVALLGGESLRDHGARVPLLLADDPRRALALAAARFHAAQPSHVAAVTGTSGKSSTVSFLRQLWTATGLPAASIGTLGVEVADQPAEASLTTPDPIRLHAALARLRASGIDHVALEASSHGLDQRRLDGVRLEAAAFTNLARDHFDYHGTVEAYLAAKRRLFEVLLPAGATAVLNADVTEFAGIREVAADRGLRLIDYGAAASTLRLVAAEATADGQRITLALEGRTHRFSCGLVGTFQAHNLLAALGLALATGGTLDALLPHLTALRAPPGRMQLAARHPSGGVAFVDYAHKPEALEKALASLRRHTAGRLTVVFGCGGDRDPGKRPLMGAIAAAGAERVIVTDDNPRSEDPAAIRAAILAAVPGATEIGDREAAIRAGFAGLAAGDALLVAGKGHETYQIVGERTLPFDDVEVLRRCAVESGGAPM